MAKKIIKTAAAVGLTAILTAIGTTEFYSHYHGNSFSPMHYFQDRASSENNGVRGQLTNNLSFFGGPEGSTPKNKNWQTRSRQMTAAIKKKKSLDEIEKSYGDKFIIAVKRGIENSNYDFRGNAKRIMEQAQIEARESLRHTGNWDEREKYKEFIQSAVEFTNQIETATESEKIEIMEEAIKGWNDKYPNKSLGLGTRKQTRHKITPANELEEIFEEKLGKLYNDKDKLARTIEQENYSILESIIEFCGQTLITAERGFWGATDSEERERYRRLIKEIEKESYGVESFMQYHKYLMKEHKRRG